MSARIDRRSFLRQLAGALAAAPFSGVLAACSSLPPATEDQLEAARVAAAHYEDLDAIIWLGNVYLDDADDALSRVEALADDLNAAPDDATALSVLESNIAADFAALRIEVVRGWTLGRTELAACALVTLAMA